MNFSAAIFHALADRFLADLKPDVVEDVGGPSDHANRFGANIVHRPDEAGGRPNFSLNGGI